MHCIVSVLALAALQVGAQTTEPTFQANNVGGGGRVSKESPHFRIFGASSTQADAAVRELEVAYTCFIGDLGWRSTGLSFNDASNRGPYSKMNIYGVSSLGAAAGQMFSDPRTGYSYLKVVTRYIADPAVTVHEFGHALAYHEKNWVDQQRTGAWWEPMANWVADTFMTSPLCAKARAQYNQPEGRTQIDLNKVIGSSHQTIVDASTGSGNYYQSWPLLTYVTNNPDKYPNLGPTTVREMMRQYKQKSNETPLHALERVAQSTPIQTIIGRYWARMAYVDIGHTQAQQLFQQLKTRINYSNLDSTGSGTYRVKRNRRPLYMGASIIPLKGTGAVTAKVTANAPFTATLAIRSQNGSVRYVDLANGAGEATRASGEEATLVIANTPSSLALYDAFSITGVVAQGLDYQVQLTGATP
ncbi:hypothetical protein P152DRAFT_52328 [Eremomyces bilateralis CBS 781.70]|uniref:Dockerin type 1 n=1 Tax=Eremomyces bilateralis CBS 781.70 TaxID=1392243 RepID=A0A6G1G129_9PEZI|nr:uncharacterized protein P152DRAFT_52328 [Eremomyces bilateralis CBS 781.70]KAF1811817.1 hypothetical protein P152DRAFT_52328 [Eremomyces bilateralis CBS 781.70]